MIEKNTHKHLRKHTQGTGNDNEGYILRGNQGIRNGHTLLKKSRNTRKKTCTNMNNKTKIKTITAKQIKKKLRNTL